MLMIKQGKREKKGPVCITVSSPGKCTSGNLRHLHCPKPVRPRNLVDAQIGTLSSYAAGRGLFVLVRLCAPTTT